MRTSHTWGTRLGHNAAFCPKRICGNCAMRGHTANECPKENLICSQCRKEGHDFFHCTTSSGKQFCLICNEHGHTHWNCVNKPSPSNKVFTCNNCGKEGHRSRECTELRACKECQKPGNTRATCPERTCRKCCKKGHTGPNCHDEWCNHCHSIGHTRETCQNNPPVCPRCFGPHCEHACRMGTKQADRSKPQRVEFKFDAIAKSDFCNFTEEDIAYPVT